MSPAIDDNAKRYRPRRIILGFHRTYIIWKQNTVK
jgi:hypothetical protein